MVYSKDSMPRYNTYMKAKKPRKWRSEKILVALIFIVAGGMFGLSFTLLPKNPGYTLRELPGPFGYEVLGLDLLQPLPDHVVESIKQDVFRHHLLLFRNVGLLEDHDRLLTITRQFGESVGPDTRGIKVDRIFRTTNEDVKNVAYTEWWHNDAYPHALPPVYALYHMATVSKNACTRFVPLDKVLECVPKEKAQYWSQFTFKFNDTYARPLVWQHPVTKRPILRLGIQMRDRYIIDPGLPTEHKGTFLKENEELIDMINTNCSHLIYNHMWGEDEIVFSDNWANAHSACEGQGKTVEDVGIREIKRTLLKGDVLPQQYLIE